VTEVVQVALNFFGSHQMFSDWQMCRILTRMLRFGKKLGTA
jgi:hypothetical protein